MKQFLKENFVLVPGVSLPAILVIMLILAQSRSFLVASVFAMLGYLGYYTEEYFSDMIGWPIALIVMGLLMIGLSSYAVKLGQNIGRPAKN